MKKVKNFHSAYTLVICFFIAYIAASRQIPLFIDDDNYLNYVLYGDIHFANLLLGIKNSITSVVSSEGLWILSNYTLGKFFDPVTSVRIIIFFSLLTFTYFLFKILKGKIFDFILTICSPQVITNFTVHLRQGYALAILFFFFRKEGWVKYLKYLSVFIHSSFIIFIIFDISNYFINRIVKDNYKLGILALLLLASMSLVSLQVYFSIFQDSKREMYDTFQADKSGFGFVFWTVMIGYLIYNAKILYFKDPYIYYSAIFGTSFYLFGYFSLPFAARVFESFYPFIIISFSFLPRNKSLIPYSLLTAYILLQWIQK